jgi:CspA family cold shock protein
MELIMPNSEPKRQFGKCIFFNDAKGWGFIKPAGQGADVWVHISRIEDEQTLLPEQRVSYVLSTDRNGRPQADDVKVLDD